MTGRTDKGRIVFLSTFVMLIFVILSIQSVRQFREANQIRERDEQAEAQLDMALQLFKADGDFFAYELNNSEFYKTGESKFIKRHDSLMMGLANLFQVFNDIEIEEDSIATNLNKYDSIFDDIVTKVKQRGYRDHGLEGTMRAKAHEIESKKLISEVDYLKLRRQEKDYLLRADSQYINKFDSIVKKNSGNSAAKPLLVDYQNALHDLAALSNIIGLETQTNLKADLDSRSNKLLAAIKKRDMAIDATIYSTHRNGILLFILGMIGSTIVCFTLIVIILKRP